MGGQPYYDMAVLGSENQRYSGVLPEPLRPQRRGLRPEQLRVYIAFQRMSRQAPAAASSEQDTAGAPGSTDSDVVRDPTDERFNRDVLTQIAAKIDSSITAILSAAGPLAPEVTLSMFPAEHEVRQLLVAVLQVVSVTLSEAEKKQAIEFAQGVFRRLYELDLSELLRLEALDALLEKMNEANTQLRQDLGTWTTYAPTDVPFWSEYFRAVSFRVSP